MSGLYKTFECKVGDCIECCSAPDMQIPVTLGDLYRACVYAQEVEGRRMTLFEAYEDRCDGWMYMPDVVDSTWVMPFPRSKIPCVNLDVKGERCTVHDTHQYVACRHYPEGMLIEDNTGIGDTEATEKFWKSLDCMQNVFLTAQREQELRDLCSLATLEIKVTGNLLHNRMQPLKGRNRAEMEEELRRRMRYMNTPQAMKLVVHNLRMNNILERYMELFGIEEPDYATVELKYEDSHDAGSIMELSDMSNPGPTKTIRRRGEKIGRNEPCLCGSGVKYKKCCGGH